MVASETLAHLDPNLKLGSAKEKNFYIFLKTQATFRLRFLL